MKIDNSKYSFLTNIFIIIGLLILFFFTKNNYYELSKLSDEREKLQYNLEEKQGNLNELKELEKKLNDSTISTLGEISKINKEFLEEEVSSYFYEYASQEESGITISNLTLSKGFLNDYSFYEGDIVISLNVENDEAMLKFTDFITNENSKYKFFIDNLNYPFGENKKDTNVSIPLKIFYK